VAYRFQIAGWICLVLVFKVLPIAAADMTVRADLTDAPRGLIRATLSIPAKPGPLTLVYPQWIPGDHGPTGPISDLSGLKISAGGKPVSWRRDLVDMFAIHLDVPEGADKLNVSLEYLGSSGDGDPTTTSQLAILNWNLIVVFPQGSDASKITVEPSLVLPAGWQYGCSMEAADKDDRTIKFKPVSLEMLIDQPVIAGRYFKQFDLTPLAKPQHVIDVAADSAAALEITDERLKAYQQLPGEYAAVFGTRPYERYHFLYALSDELHFSGLEHHQCSDNQGAERTLVDGDLFSSAAYLLTHEYFHSWNGKHRRPAGLMSPDYQKPMQDDLLWVYEGLTEYYGDVMAARAGLWTPEEFHDQIATNVARLAATQGRTWRPLQDTADFAQKLYGTSRNWGMRRRGVDFYDEGELIWLDADTLIRQKSGGKKSLDDFCRAFHGEGHGGPALGGEKPTVIPYTVDEVYSTLNSIVPNDWKSFFTSRLTSLDPKPPTNGLTQGGWKLAYTKKPNKLLDASNKATKRIDLRFSLGLLLSSEDDHAIIDVVPDSPADKAGLGPGMNVLAINERKFDDDVLDEAIDDTPKSKAVELLVENGSYIQSKKLDYDGGPRYPHLERIESSPDLISKVIEARSK
jgi:predicted metalloprotease with PDZ domain